MGNPPGHRARKRFGQHFLRDQHTIQGIIAAIRPQRDDSLVEIGPGLGALTESLLAELGEMDAVELDRDLIPRLQQRYTSLRVYNADALKFNFCSLSGGSDGRLRVVGNLPYNISTPLIFHLLDQSHCIRDMHFMLQKEVVDRIVAQPGGRSYGRLSVMVQYQCLVERLFDVSPTAFAPPPKVESAVVRLIPHSTPPFQALDKGLFALVVTQAFARRRKTLRNGMKGMIAADTIEALGIDSGCRPENLTLEQLVSLSNVVAKDGMEHC